MSSNQRQAALEQFEAGREHRRQQDFSRAGGVKRAVSADDAHSSFATRNEGADIEHADASSELLETYVNTPAEIAQARRAGAVTLWAWREMHEGILRVLHQRYDF